MSATSQSASTAVLRYFARRYPGRGGVASMIFRRGEGGRAAVVERWLDGCAGRSVLDCGCGDGEFLGQALAARPALLRLEDLVPHMAGVAASRLQGRADRLESAANDARRAPDPRRFDVVLALGVIDYVADWRSLLRVLLGRADGALILSVPRAGHPHHALRRLWLSLHGIHLTALTRAALDSALAELPGRERLAVEVVDLGLEWVVRIARAGG